MQFKWLTSGIRVEMFSSSKVPALLLLSVCAIACIHCKKTVGPFDIDWYAAGFCDDVGTNEVKVDIRIITHRRGQSAFNVNVSLPWGISDSITVDIKVYIWANKAWKSLIHHNFGGMCTAFKRYAPDVAKIVFRLFQTNDCLEPGDYTLYKASIPTKIQGVALPIYGKLRLEIGMLKKANYKRVGCFFMEADFLPKKSLKPTI